MPRDTITIGHLSAPKVSLALLSLLGLVAWAAWTLFFLYEEQTGRQRTQLFAVVGAGLYCVGLLSLMAARAFTSTPALFIRDGRLNYLFSFLRWPRLEEIRSVTLRPVPGLKTPILLTVELRSGARKVISAFLFRTPKQVMLSRLAEAGLPVEGFAQVAPSKQAADEPVEPR
jgi:hypothetical protein